VTKSKDKRIDLFNKQLITFTQCNNQVANAVKIKYICSPKASIYIIALEQLQPLLTKVYSMTWRKEINKESVPNDEKLFSIYKLHTNIRVKGAREVQFAHKVNFSTGKSNLILTCDMLKGNPGDNTLFQPTIDKVVEKYGVIPRDSATDGGYASKANAGYAEKKGIKNTVFNKTAGCLKNIVSSKNIETRLKKWRVGIEAVISNFKRGYNMFRCNWKGEAHFNQKVLWSTIAYNIRVMTAAVVAKL